MVVVQDEAGLKWLEPWLRLPFYEEHYKCNKHPKKYNVVYCAICQDMPQCEICWDNYKTQHQEGHHIVLQVMISSGRAGIKRAEISKYLDVSDIQKYSINSKDIVFLNPNVGGVRKEDYHPKCATCKRQLIPTQEDKGFRFCSIHCKKEDMEGNLMVEKRVDVDVKDEQQPMALQRKKKRTMSYVRKRRVEEHDEQIETMIDFAEKKMRLPMRMMSGSRCLSVRKRGRKGIPHRAPLM